jgi:tellurite methyltransferase
MASDFHTHNDQPASFLVENTGLLKKGRVLDIAMGTGRNAIYLARLGFEVEGVDISEEAVREALRSARENGVSIKAMVADLEKDYRIEPETYDLIICFNYLQRSLIPQMKAGLKKGGFIVYETFILDQAQFGSPRNLAFLLGHNELLNLFRDFRCLRYREGVIEDRKAVASLVAQKVEGI